MRLVYSLVGNVQALHLVMVTSAFGASGACGGEEGSQGNQPIAGAAAQNLPPSGAGQGGHAVDAGETMEPQMPATSSSLDGLVAYYPFDGDAQDHSGHENHCQVHGATLSTDRSGRQSAAYHFDGASYMECGNSASVQITESITLAAWVKAEPASLTGVNRIVFGKWGPSSRSYALYIQNQDQASLGLCGSTHGAAVIGSPDGSGALLNSPTRSVLCDSAEIQANTWHHLTATIEPGYRMAVYVDRRLAAESTQSVIPMVFGGTEPLSVGLNQGYYFAGSLDELRLYNRALTADEVSSLP